MTRNTWLKNAAPKLLLCLMAAAGIGVLGCEQESLLPNYTMDQTDSSHPGYRRTTLTSGNTLYVSDYEEYPLQLMNMTMNNVVGHVGFAEDKADLDAVDGEAPNSYVVINEGMYPDGIYRNIKTPPFNWRTAKFQTMGFAHPVGPGAQKTTTDPVLIDEVLSVLRDGSTVTLPVSVNITNADLCNLLLTSDQLPGLFFGPFVYMDKTGGIYLTYHVAVPEWRAAGPLLSQWVTTKRKLFPFCSREPARGCFLACQKAASRLAATIGFMPFASSSCRFVPQNRFDLTPPVG